MKVIRVVAAAIVQRDRVLVARRRPELARGDLWELPGGKVEAGEDDREALAREIAEELQLSVTVGECLGEAVHDYGDVAIRLVAYACEHVAGEPALTDHAEVRWLDAPALDGLDWAPADVPLLPPLRAWMARRRR